MAENKNSQQKKRLPLVEPENLPVIYNNLLAYINTVVTFRFTTLGFYLAAVALILGVNSSFERYLILVFITISLYIIELRNRFLKNELEAQVKQIQKKWHYIEGGYNDDELQPTTIFGMVINKKDDILEINKSEPKPEFGKFLTLKITHSIALDSLYFSIFIYALVRIILLLNGVGQ